LSITLGSSSAIFAHNLSSLGNKVGFSSCIGSDPFGEICIQRLGTSGVDLSRVRRLAGKTTGLTVILPQRQQRFILTYPGTMYDLSDKDLDLRYVFDAKHLHVSSYFLQKAIRPRLIDIFRKAKEAGLTTSLDTNDDPEDRWPADIQHSPAPRRSSCRGRSSTRSSERGRRRATPRFTPRVPGGRARRTTWSPRAVAAGGSLAETNPEQAKYEKEPPVPSHRQAGCAGVSAHLPAVWIYRTILLTTRGGRWIVGRRPG